MLPDRGLSASCTWPTTVSSTCRNRGAMMKFNATFRRLVRAVVFSLLLLQAPFALLGQPVSYDIIYVRQPRYGSSTNTIWPEVFHPARLDPGADLMLLHPDGTEELLVPGGLGSVTDPFVAFDAQWCYYAYFPNLQTDQLNYQRENLP